MSVESWLSYIVVRTLTLLATTESESRFSHNNKGSRISLCVHCSTQDHHIRYTGKSYHPSRAQPGGAIWCGINKGRNCLLVCLPKLEITFLPLYWYTFCQPCICIDSLDNLKDFYGIRFFFNKVKVLEISLQRFRI